MDERDSGGSAGGPSRDGWIAAVRDGYDELADAYDAERDPPPAGIEAVAAFEAALDDDARLLDVGCGGGRLVLETLAAEYDAIGLDLSREQLTLARGRVPDGAFVQGEMTWLPIGSNAVDALTSLHAVIHLPRERHPDAFAEFARVLRPGGRLLVTVGEGSWEGETDDWLDGGAAMRWSFPDEATARERLRDAGFAVEDATVADDELGGGQWIFLRARLGD